MYNNQGLARRWKITTIRRIIEYLRKKIAIVVNEIEKSELVGI